MTNDNEPDDKPSAVPIPLDVLVIVALIAVIGWIVALSLVMAAL